MTIKLGCTTIRAFKPIVKELENEKIAKATGKEVEVKQPNSKPCCQPISIKTYKKTSKKILLGFAVVATVGVMFARCYATKQVEKFIDKEYEIRGLTKSVQTDAYTETVEYKEVSDAPVEDSDEPVNNVVFRLETAMPVRPAKKLEEEVIIDEVEEDEDEFNMPPPPMGPPPKHMRGRRGHWGRKFHMLEWYLDFDNMKIEEAKAAAKTLINWAALGIFTHFTIMLAVVSGICLCSVKKVQRAQKIRDACKVEAPAQQQPLMFQAQDSMFIPKSAAFNY